MTAARHGMTATGRRRVRAARCFCCASIVTGRARCESPVDVNTIEVLHNQHPECIRLNGIDCPEKGQAYGNNAKHAASKLVFGKEVTLLTHGLDKSGRTLADVLLPDGTNVNHTLIKDGWCWWFPKNALEDTVLEWLERDAREGRKGLWADPRPVQGEQPAA